MKVILLQDVENLGDQGEVVSVKNGYGRNFLIPRSLAQLATKSSLKQHAEITRQRAHKVAKAKEGAEAMAKRMSELELVIVAKVGEGGRIFGSVTTSQVANELAAKGLDIPRRKIKINQTIKTTGEYTATVRIHPEVDGTVKIQVVPGG